MRRANGCRSSCQPNKGRRLFGSCGDASATLVGNQLLCLRMVGGAEKRRFKTSRRLVMSNKTKESKADFVRPPPIPVINSYNMVPRLASSAFVVIGSRVLGGSLSGVGLSDSKSRLCAEIRHQMSVKPNAWQKNKMFSNRGSS